MPFLKDFIQNLFGGDGNSKRPNQGFDDHGQHSEHFRNPIWQNGEEDDDDEYGDDYRPSTNSGPGIHFEVFTSPFEMTRFFETEIDGLLKNFFSFGFGDNSDIPSFSNVPQILPPPNSRPKSLRDEVLKPGYATPPPNHGIDTPKVDEDLDGKVDVSDFPQIWSNPDRSESQLQIPRRQFNFSYNKSVISQTIRRPDGTIEERRTVTDGDGNSETTIKRQIGDKTHIVTTKTDKNGVETKTENFKNIDDGEIKDFRKNWMPVEEPKFEPGILSKFPWEKFFGSNPKL